MISRFTWNLLKEQANRRKHRLDFATASRVFADPWALLEQDRVEGHEYRWQTIGLVDGYLVVLVAHSYIDDENNDDVIRIISARRADRAERRRYEARRTGPV